MDINKQNFDYSKRDKRRLKILKNLIHDNQIPIEFILENFPLFCKRRDFTRFFSHFELFNKIKDLPGNIVELGVFNGTSLLSWAIFLETFLSTDRYRKVYGFDSFEGLQDFSPKDGKNIQSSDSEKYVGGYCSKEDVTETFVQLFNEDAVIPNVNRVELIKGNIFDTIPPFLDDRPGFKISLLHLDLDLYKPTKFALNTLYSHVVRGGVIIFDEYGIPPWEGETHAVDEFLDSNNFKDKVVKFNYSSSPGAYIIKS